MSYAACYPVTRWIRSVEPTTAQEPITLTQAKQQCKIPTEVSDYDEDIQRMIVSSRRQVETDCAVACYTGTFTRKFNAFPCGDVLELGDIRPITSITSIVYTWTDGSLTTWSSSQYVLHNGTATPFVGLAYGYTWPTVRGDINGITVTVVAGYATVAALPEEIRRAVLLQVNIHWEDSLGQDTAKMRQAYDNYITRIRREFYA